MNVHSVFFNKLFSLLGRKFTNSKKALLENNAILCGLEELEHTAIQKLKHLFHSRKCFWLSRTCCPCLKFKLFKNIKTLLGRIAKICEKTKLATYKQSKGKQLSCSDNSVFSCPSFLKIFYMQKYKTTPFCKKSTLRLGERRKNKTRQLSQAWTIFVLEIHSGFLANLWHF